MSKLAELQKTSTLHDLAVLLGFKPSAISYLLYVKKNSDKYTIFEIPKSNGSFRTIKSPIPELKHLQLRLAKLLQECENEIHGSVGTWNSYSHGFRQGYSIITNAAQHKNRLYVFNTDLNDFFGSINFGRVRGFFIRNKDFQLRDNIATLIAQICCHDNSLPQGSPVSPIISNLIGSILDLRLSRLARKYKCTYTRYADDLTFSTNKKIFPLEIAFKPSDSKPYWKVGEEFEAIVKKSGFSINHAKTRMLFKDFRQEVTGLTVNSKVSVKRAYWREARAMAHSLFLNGEYFIKAKVVDENGNVTLMKNKGSINYLRGVLDFINQIDRFNHTLLPPGGANKRHLNIREELYRKFIVYTSFYANDKPIILGEGKTDSVYIKAAIKNLHNKHPKLASIVDGKLETNLGFFSYSDTAKEICSLGGGTGDFGDFIFSYLKDINKFKFPDKPTNPVIILVDNDRGSKKVFSITKKLINTELPVTGDDDFYHLGHNLYVVSLPRLNGTHTSIEYFFPKQLLDTKLNGKKFSYKNSFDPSTEYGKHFFSKYVVAPNQLTIDFSKFDAILSRLDAVLDHYSGL